MVAGNGLIEDPSWCIDLGHDWRTASSSDGDPGRDVALGGRPQHSLVSHAVDHMSATHSCQTGHLFSKPERSQVSRDESFSLSHHPQHLAATIYPICIADFQPSNLLLSLLSLLLLHPLQLFKSPSLFLPLLDLQLFDLFIQHDFLLHEVRTIGFQFGDLLERCCFCCFLFFLLREKR